MYEMAERYGVRPECTKRRLAVTACPAANAEPTYSEPCFKACTHECQAMPAFGDRNAVNRVLVAYQVARSFIPPEGFSDLLRYPFRCWASRDDDPDELQAPAGLAGQSPKRALDEPDGRVRRQIHRRDVRRMVTQEGPPALAGWID